MLFINIKNTKLTYIKGVVDNLVLIYKSQEEVQAKAIDLQFYSRDYTFINIAKEVTLEDYILLYYSIPNNFKVETFLQKYYYLEAYAYTRIKFLEDSKQA